MVPKLRVAGLRVVINAQLPFDGTDGGVEQFTLSLIRALGGRFEDDVSYVIVARPPGDDVLEPILGPNQTLVRGPGATQEPEVPRGRSRFLGPLGRPAIHLWNEALKRRNRFWTLPASDGFYESLEANIVHFPYQSFVRTNLPTVFNPHDLLHIHHPEFFSKDQIQWRRFLYRTAFISSERVVAESTWAKEDIQKAYSLDPSRIEVIYRGSPLDFYDIDDEDLERCVAQYRLPKKFGLYPAQTWPHKNHLRLVEAIGRVCSDGLDVHVLCTGVKNEFWPTIEERIAHLGLRDRVRFAGFVPPQDLRAFYRLAGYTIFPSLFEGGGFPVTEALREGQPLACSDLPPLREYAKEAAYFFDPASVDNIAKAIRAMESDSALTGKLRSRAQERGREISWDDAAKKYSSLYRTLAKAPRSR